LRDRCTPAKKAKCAENSGPSLPIVCSTCESRKPFQPSEWLNHCYYLYQLQRGGYPFGKNDLDVEEWIAIGEIREELESWKTGAR
jgi:hypothetical protein